MRVLIVEDDVKLASLIRRGLREEGLAADVAIRGEDALWMAAEGGYDVVILDLALPGIDGLETCRQLREAGVRTPIMMLTSRGEIEDRIEGLNQGADDYLVKPFSFGELLARLHALSRRGEITVTAVLEIDDLRLDPVKHRAWRGDTELDLSAREFQLLEGLMRHPGEAMSRNQLLNIAWDRDYHGQSNVVDVYIGYLRDKVDRPFGRSNIKTVRGVGYRLEASADDELRHPSMTE
jgi:two-component system, OmpR family, response regulator